MSSTDSEGNYEKYFSSGDWVSIKDIDLNGPEDEVEEKLADKGLIDKGDYPDQRLLQYGVEESSKNIRFKGVVIFDSTSQDDPKATKFSYADGKFLNSTGESLSVKDFDMIIRALPADYFAVFHILSPRTPGEYRVALNSDDPLLKPKGQVL